MKTVTKAGQKFMFLGDIYTVKSFFGSSGVEYSTFADARKANPNDNSILVKNVEFDGCSKVCESFKIEG